MNKDQRTFCIYGQGAGAVGRILIDGKLVHDGEFDHYMLYQFTTPIFGHGYLPVEIYISKGHISIEEIFVTYPAKIKPKSFPARIFARARLGYITGRQPINSPILDLTDNFLPLPIVIHDQLLCKHIMFNGPNFFHILVKKHVDLYDGMNISPHYNGTVGHRQCFLYDHKLPQWGSAIEEKKLATIKLSI